VHSTDAVYQVAGEAGAAGARVTRHREIDLRHFDAPGIDAVPADVHVPDRLKQQTGRDDEQHAQRDLGGDEGVAHPQTIGGSLRFVLERGHHVGLRSVERWRQARQDGGQERRRRRKGDDSQIERQVQLHGQWKRRQQPHERGRHPTREYQAERAAADDEHDRFGE
jgi:hypothetical protein